MIFLGLRGLVVLGEVYRDLCGCDLVLWVFSLGLVVCVY